MNKNNHSINDKEVVGHEKIRVCLDKENSHNSAWVFSNLFSIGRIISADVCIKDQSVSRVHAVVYYSKGRWWIQDMNSLNGTIVNERKIIRKPLGSETQIRLGWDGPKLQLTREKNGHKKTFYNKPEESTQISSNKVTVILAEGLDNQKEWRFTRPFSIGRHSGSDILISDEIVSRFQSNVYFKEGKWWVQDMNSTNGTFVDDKKIFKKQLGYKTVLRLGRDGPKLHIYLEKMNGINSATDKQVLRQNGNNEYTVMNEDEYDVEAPTGFYRRKKISGYDKKLKRKKGVEIFNIAHNKYIQFKKYRKYFYVVAPILLIGLVMAGYGYLQEKRSQNADRQQKIVSKTYAGNKNYGKALTTKGKNEAKISAMATYKVHDQTTGFQGNTGKEAGREKQDPALSQISDIYFNAAKTFSENHYWEVALEYYKIISEIKPDYPDLDTKIEKMRFEIGNHELYEEGVAFIAKGRYAEGIERLKTIHKNSAYYDMVSQVMAKARKKQKKQKLAEAQANKDQKVKSAIKGALQYYMDGKIKSSLNNLDLVLRADNPASRKIKSRAKKIRKNIYYCELLYNKANTQYENGEIDLAIATWKKLLKKESELLPKKNSYFSKSVRNKIANEYYTKSFKAFMEGKFQNAHLYNKIALSHIRNHDKSLEIKKMLIEKSKLLFKEGYILEEYNPQKAMEKWREILKISAPEDEYYKKALMKINTR